MPVPAPRVMAAHARHDRCVCVCLAGGPCKRPHQPCRCCQPVCPACCTCLSASPLVPGPHQPLPSRVLTGCLLHPGAQPPEPQGHRGHLGGGQWQARAGRDNNRQVRQQVHVHKKRYSASGGALRQGGFRQATSTLRCATASLAGGTWRLAPLRPSPCGCVESSVRVSAAEPALTCVWCEAVHQCCC